MQTELRRPVRPQPWALVGILLAGVAAPALGADPAPAPAPATRSDPARLQAALNRVLDQPAARKLKVGVSVVSLPDGQPLFARNADQPLAPASNLKLVTTIAALELLGPRFQYTTQFARRGEDLVVVGAGDPCLGDTALTDAAGVPSTWMFDRWAAVLQQAGITHVRDVIIDDAVFEAPSAHPSWPEDQRLTWYAAEVGGLNFNTNCVDISALATRSGITVQLRPANTYIPVTNTLRAGRSDVLSARRPADSNALTVSGTATAGQSGWVNLSVRDPGLFFGQALATHLASKGITVSGTIRRARVTDARYALPPDCQLLARFHSPIWDALRRANRQSQNMYAECLFKSVSAYAPDGRPLWLAGELATSQPADAHYRPAAQGSWEASRKVIGAYLKGLGIAEQEFTLDDGSGLSRNNRVSPRLMTTLLAEAFRSPMRDPWLDTLAASGAGGTTLQRRMTGPGLRGNVLAKTGYIKGVSALSGYVRGPNDRWAAFSVLCNNLAVGPGDAKDVQDQVARAIYDWLAN